MVSKVTQVLGTAAIATAALLTQVQAAAADQCEDAKARSRIARDRLGGHETWTDPVTGIRVLGANDKTTNYAYRGQYGNTRIHGAGERPPAGVEIRGDRTCVSGPTVREAPRRERVQEERPAQVRKRAPARGKDCSCNGG